VVGGELRSRRFDIPRTFKARPTTDFAKENLFNVLSNLMDFDGAVALDLFSGTGSISLELVSRGCSQVISVEKDPLHHSFIREVMERVKTDHCVTIRGDAFKFIKRCSTQFNLIFADPPYQMSGLALLPELIFSRQLLMPEGIFVLEHGDKSRFTDNPNFFQMRVYGAVHFSFFRAKGKANEEQTP
jgi:16S rRNA (guanine(966)-N(2))-methyltransferase RsmD